MCQHVPAPLQHMHMLHAVLAEDGGASLHLVGGLEQALHLLNDIVDRLRGAHLKAALQHEMRDSHSHITKHAHAHAAACRHCVELSCMQLRAPFAAQSCRRQ